MGGFLRKKKKFKLMNWQLLLILLPLLFLTATLLRFDHIKMTELRDAVLATDLAGDTAESQEEANNNIIKALDELKSFTFTHVIVNITEKNGVQSLTFGTGPFYLEHQYNRAAKVAIAAAEQKAAEIGAAGNPGGNIYAAASAVCDPEARRMGWTWDSEGHVNCMLREIAARQSEYEITDRILADIPDTNLYRYNFASPIFAPTPAAFLALLSIILTIIIIVRFLIWLVVEISLIFIKNPS